MTDFESETFNVKQWIDAACRQKPTNAPLDAFVTQLEMQLQLKAEEAEQEIEATASKMAALMPHVLTEAERIEEEMVGLQEMLMSRVEELSERSMRAGETMRGIKELHQIKSNMQSACDSLKEATELSELFVRVDAVFNSGDIFAMAKIISTMHQSLKLVGNVPEFKAGKEKLKVLEGNLVSSIEVKLASAIADGQSWDDHVKQLSEILNALDRYASVEKTYVAAKMQGIKTTVQLPPKAAHVSDAEWEKRVIDDVRDWHDHLVRNISEELEWCRALFPEQCPSLMTAFLTALFKEWNKSLEAAILDRASISFALLVQRSILEFCLTLQQLLESVIGQELVSALVECAFVPTEKAVVQFGHLERQIFIRAIDQFSVESFIPVEQMETSIKTLLQLVDRGMEDCVLLTGGTGLEKLASEVEFCLLKFVSVMTASVKSIRSEVLLETSAEDLDRVASVLHLLKVGMSLEAMLDQINTQLIQTKGTVQSNLTQQASGIDLVRLRLLKSPDKEHQLLGFLEKQEWKGCFSVGQSIDGFKAASEALVFDVLMHKPRSLFKGFGEMSEWTKVESGSSLGIPLPQFSAYPLHYVSAFGEYIMLVPQQLEGLVSTDTETDNQILDQEEQMASTLLTKVITGCAELYADEILSLKRISSSGVVQLTCDLQYFSNVLFAMGFTIPASLTSVIESIQSPTETLKQLIEAEQHDSNKRFVLSRILDIRERAS